MQGTGRKAEPWLREVAALLLDAMELVRDQQRELQAAGSTRTAARCSGLLERYEDLIHRTDQE